MWGGANRTPDSQCVLGTSWVPGFVLETLQGMMGMSTIFRWLAGQ